MLTRNEKNRCDWNTIIYIDYKRAPSENLRELFCMKGIRDAN